MSKQHEDFDGNQTKKHEPKNDPFDQLMFGQRVKNVKSVEDQGEVNKENSTADFSHLLGQLDDIMTSINNIKPAIKELSPLLDYFRKK
jgi:hypothetical protein